MKIFRVETEAGEGPYRGNCSKCAMDDVYAECGEERWGTPGVHPTPFADPKLKFYDLPFTEQEEYSFGFKTVQQCKDWFYKEAWRAALAKRGFLLAEYEVAPRMWKASKHQAVFKKNKAKRIAVHNLTDI